MDKGINILIVDDLAAMRLIIKDLFRELGYESTVEADDGTTALPMLQGGSFDFLVTDSGTSGFDLLKAVRADPDLATLPVMMISAEAKRDQIVAAVQAGVNGYILKPFTALTLEQKLSEIFERRGDAA